MPGWKNAGALALALLVATAWTAAQPAEARQRARTQRVELIRPDHTTDADASGVVKVRDGRRMDVMVVRLRRLDPRTDYELRDLDTEETLATVRTNRRGRARVRLRAGNVRKASLDELPNAVGVFDAETDECVLETDEPIGDTGPVEGFKTYDGPQGHTGLVGLISIPELEMECFLLSMYPALERGEDEGERGENDRPDIWHECPCEIFEFVVEKGFTDKQLPLGVESARELAERAFEVRDGDGNVVLSGNLPAVKPIEFEKPDLPDFPDRPDRPDFPDMPDLPPWMDGGPDDRNEIPFFAFKDEIPKSEFVLWIADEEGVLQEVGALDHIDFCDFFDDLPDFPDRPDRGDGGGDSPAPPNDRGFPGFR